MAGVIVALDRPTAAEALDLVDRIGEGGAFYKVGLELFGGAGPEVVRALRTRGKRVFLDLKLHDIPNTVAGAVRAAVALEVELLTVHAAGGPAMLEAALQAADGEARVVAVTLLTSLSPTDVEAVWGREVASIREEVLRLARLSRSAGLDGIVASPLEASWVRRALGPDFLIVTPGIRPSGSAHGDQKRVATPAEAVAAGANHLVVGRAVTEADDPAAALAGVLAEIGDATD